MTEFIENWIGSQIRYRCQPVRKRRRQAQIRYRCQSVRTRRRSARKRCDTGAEQRFVPAGHSSGPISKQITVMAK